MIQHELDKLWSQEDTHAEIELKFTMRPSQSRNCRCHDLVAKVRSRQPRTSEVLEPAAATWFENAVDRIGCLDRTVSEFVGASNLNGEVSSGG